MEQTENEKRKASPFELPESLGFRAGEEVRMKDDSDKQWMIMGFSRGHVILMNSDGRLRMTPEQLTEHFERVDTPKRQPEHALEDLV